MSTPITAVAVSAAHFFITQSFMPSPRTHRSHFTHPPTMLPPSSSMNAQALSIWESQTPSIQQNARDTTTTELSFQDIIQLLSPAPDRSPREAAAVEVQERQHCRGGHARAVRAREPAAARYMAPW